MFGREHQMTKKRKHSKAEIAFKLAEADDLVTEGKLQSEIARALGVSVMTLHRWRKLRHSRMVRAKSIRSRKPELPNSNSKIHGCGDWWLLEQMKREEVSQVGEPSMRWLNEPSPEPRLIRSSRS